LCSAFANCVTSWARGEDFSRLQIAKSREMSGAFCFRQSVLGGSEVIVHTKAQIA
jgi:hypothetical protein